MATPSGTTASLRGNVPKTPGPFDVKSMAKDWNSSFAVRDIAKGEVISTSRGTYYDEPTRFSVQASTHQHVEFFGGLEYTNHSCSPNASFVVSATEPSVSLVAIRDIAKGESLTFDYNTTEWDMTEKFQCQCGVATCRGKIGGAKYLTHQELAPLLPYFSANNLRHLLSRELSKAEAK